MNSIQGMRLSLKKEIPAMADAFDFEKLSDVVKGNIATSMTLCFEDPELFKMTSSDALLAVKRCCLLTLGKYTPLSP